VKTLEEEIALIRAGRGLAVTAPAPTPCATGRWILTELSRRTVAISTTFISGSRPNKFSIRTRSLLINVSAMSSCTSKREPAVTHA